MTETTQDLLARLTGFCKNAAKMKCPCGHKSCSQYTLTTQGSVGFDLQDADLYAAAPRLHREMTAALAREAGLREALKNLVDHPAFDRNYISAELASKLDAGAAALGVKP